MPTIPLMCQSNRTPGLQATPVSLYQAFPQTRLTYFPYQTAVWSELGQEVSTAQTGMQRKAIDTMQDSALCVGKPLTTHSSWVQLQPSPDLLSVLAVLLTPKLVLIPVQDPRPATPSLCLNLLTLQGEGFAHVDFLLLDHSQGHRSWPIVLFFPQSTQLHGNLSCSICCIGEVLQFLVIVHENCLICRCIFTCLGWGTVSFTSFYFTILIPPLISLDWPSFVAVYFHNMKHCFYRTYISLYLPIYFLIYVDCVIT